MSWINWKVMDESVADSVLVCLVCSRCFLLKSNLNLSNHDSLENFKENLLKQGFQVYACLRVSFLKFSYLSLSHLPFKVS